MAYRASLRPGRAVAQNGSGPPAGGGMSRSRGDKRLSVQGAAATRTPREPDSHSARILIVDDDPLARSAMRDLLEFSGFEAVAVERGEEVFPLLGKVDLVLLDAMLPDRDGWSICRELKEEHDPFLPVIMVTARAAPADMARTFEAHADDYVTKPFQPAELVARIRSRLRVRRLEQELQELAEQNYQLYEQAAKHVAEKESLLRELDHRVRNNLAIITGLATLERCRRPARPSEEALASLENRFRAFLLAYDVMRRRGYCSVPIRQIVEPLLQRLRNMAPAFERIELEVSGDAADLDERQAMALSLVLHEVITNAIEHAFPDGREGRIALHIEDQGNDIRISISDDGVGFDPTDLPDISGSGLSIIRALVHGNLAGEVSFDSGPGGTTVSFTFPQELPEPPTVGGGHLPGQGLSASGLTRS